MRRDTVCAIRPSAGATWRTPNEVCNTLNIWNPADLARFPDAVLGVRPYTVLPDDDYGRASIFYRAAAARPGLHKRRNAASDSTAAIDLPKPGEW